MAFTLDQVVPWGRSYDEYLAMFALGAADLAGRLLGCGDGPAAFNAGHTRRGGRVISADPVYRFSAAELRGRIAATCDQVLEQTRRNADQFVWDTIRSPDELGRVRMAAMDEFLADYEPGKAAGRYLDAALPALPFPNRAFDLALCSHFLFLYSDHFDAAFHGDAVVELCRVAREVRIFPLLELNGHTSRHLPAVRERLRAAGYASDIEPVPYQFQRGGNQMLRVRAG